MLVLGPVSVIPLARMRVVSVRELVLPANHFMQQDDGAKGSCGRVHRTALRQTALFLHTKLNILVPVTHVS